MENKNWKYIPNIDPIHNFNIDEKIDWMEGRIKRWIFEPINEIEKDYLRSRDGREKTNDRYKNMPLIIVTIICLGIDAICRFYNANTEKEIKKKMERSLII